MSHSGELELNVYRRTRTDLVLETGARGVVCGSGVGGCLCYIWTQYLLSELTVKCA